MIKNWTQIVDPLNNIFLSALVAMVPMIFIFWALIVKKMKGHYASLLATAIALLVAVIIYRMPVGVALLSTFHGILYGLFPICWIVIAIIFLFNIIVKSGQLEIIKHSMASVTSDRRLQALLIAFAFGAFLEGTAGFGAPVAITAALLVGLGFDPFYAAGICLIANTAPVAFGAVGIPITVASQVTGIPEMAISQMVGRTLPVLSLLIPFYLVILISGFRKSMEILPAILVTGVSFAFLQWFSSNFLGPALPDIIAGGGCIICLVTFLKYWKPKSIWRFKNEKNPTINREIHYTTKQVTRAWFPFILLTIMIIGWGLQPVKEALNSIGMLQFKIPGIHNVIIDSNGNPIKHVFVFNYLSASGSAIFITALITILLAKLKITEGFELFFSTIKQLRFPIITVAAILGFAYIINDSGIAITIAHALANTGFLYPFFAPVLGWLGVFITGSDTSSNALFGKLQHVTATSIGVDPLVTVAANSSGGVVGKMISPQSIAVATASVGLVGKESDLFRFTVKHSFIMLLLICLLTFAQAYFIKWIIPLYPPPKVEKVVTQIPHGNKTVSSYSHLYKSHEMFF
jgi:lactate permease